MDDKLNSQGIPIRSNREWRELAQKTVAEHEQLMKAVQVLIVDIEAMQPRSSPDSRGGKESHWFGPFSEFDEQEDGVIVEWPNLAISFEALKNAFALAKLVGGR